MLKRVILLALFAVALSSNPVFAFSIGSLSPNDQMTIQQAIGRTASLNFPPRAIRDCAPISAGVQGRLGRANGAFFSGAKPSAALQHPANGGNVSPV
jgi:hypothetical protein